MDLIYFWNFVETSSHWHKSYYNLTNTYCKTVCACVSVCSLTVMWLKFCRPAWKPVGVVCTVKIEIPGGEDIMKVHSGRLT